MVWLKVKGYNGQYLLSEKGDLKRREGRDGTHIVKSCIASNGKRYVTLWSDGKRKNVMLHNLYAETFCVPIKTAMRILYEDFDGDATARIRVRTWLLDKIQECELMESNGASLHDDILYLKSFLEQINESTTLT